MCRGSQNWITVTENWNRVENKRLSPLRAQQHRLSVVQVARKVRGKKSEASCLNEMLHAMISLDRWRQLIVFCCVSPTLTRGECHFCWWGSNIRAGNLAILGGHQHPRHGHHHHLILDKYKTWYYVRMNWQGQDCRVISGHIFVHVWCNEWHFC